MSTSTQGKTLQFAAGTLTSAEATQNYIHIRPDEFPEIVHQEVMIAENPNMGNRHFADVSDKPVTYEKYRESALSFPYRMRSNNTASEIDFIRAAFVSGGCTATVNSTAETLVSNLSSGSFETTSANPSEGQGVVLGDSATGTAFPVVAYDKSSLVYSNTAESQWSADSIRKSVSITPGTVPTSDGYFLSFKQGTRLPASSNQEHWDLTSCALAGVDEIVLKPGDPIVFPFNFHVGDVANSDASLATEDFVDSEKFPVLSSSNFECMLTNSPAAAWSSPLTNDATTRFNLIEAGLTLGIGTVPIDGAGNAAVNDLQDYMATYEAARIRIRGLFAKAYWDDVNDETFQEKYIHFLQKSNDYDAMPSFGFFFPRCHQISNPVLVAETPGYYMMDLSYVASMGAINGDTGITQLGAAPWYFVYSLLA